MNEKYIQNIIKNYYMRKYVAVSNNIIYFVDRMSYEADIMLIQKSLYMEEFEIKVSKNDFKADFKKWNKHKLLQSGKEGMPNKFSYVVPKNLIDLKEVPEYAGLYYISEDGEFLKIKNPPKLHKNKYQNLFSFARQAAIR